MNPAILLSSTFHWGGSLAYARDGNPVWEALEQVIGDLEGGHAVVFSSGMAAIAAVVDPLPVGAVIVAPADAYNGTRHLLLELAARHRVELRLADLTDTEGTLQACQGAEMLWLESPTNPLMAIGDLRTLCNGARDRGVKAVVDNTFATPLLQRPIGMGADVVVHSATKYLSGHSDVVCGAVVAARPDEADAIRGYRSLYGAIMGPLETYLVLRGVRTLDVRMARAQTSAQVLAERLASHRVVSNVRYPGLSGHPGHELAKAQMDGFGAMLSFDVGPEGGDEAAVEAAVASAEAVCAAVSLCTDATSLGGVETLVERRKRWDFEDLTPPGLIRMSVGIEDVEDIWEDLDKALAAIG